MENQVSIIAEYAKKQFGIELTEAQLELIKLVSEGKTIVQRPPRMGVSMANRVMRAYLADALQPAPEPGARKYWYKLTPGLLDILFIMVQYVHETGVNEFTMKDLYSRLKPYQYNQTTKLRFHGLIAKVKDENGTFHGKWLVTRRTGDFLRNEIVLPQKVQTQNNAIIGYDDITVSIKDVYKGDVYLEGRAEFINKPLPSSKAVA